MSPVAATILLLLRIYTYILVARILIEMIGGFSRNFRPPAWFSRIAEVFFVLTDPPVRWLRKLIPPLRMGNVGLDISVLVLFFALQIVQVLVVRVA